MSAAPAARASGVAAARVSVVLPCRNEVLHIRGCLASVLALEAPAGGFEVLVADGMSDDGTRAIVGEIAARDRRVRLLDNPRRITPSGLNAAVASACGDIIVRVDAHTEYAPDYLLQCVAALEATGADNVGGPARTRPSGRVQRAIAAAYHSPFAAGGARFHRPDYTGPVDTVPYGCWRRQVFERVGLFDEELVRNQDDEHNLRITRAGGLVWQSSSIRSWYCTRSSLSALFRQYFQYGYWKVRVMQKHRLPASWRHLVPGAFVGVLLILCVAAPAAPLARAGVGALAGLYAGCALAASAVTARGAGWDLLPLLPAVFACYHVGYGLGWLWGLWDFVLLRRGGRFAGLTR